MADALIRLPIRAASRTASRVPSTGYGDSGPQIVLSNANQLEGTSTGTTFGNLSVVGGSGTWTFTKTADTDSAFTLTSAALKNAVVFNYEVKSLYAVTIEATNGTLTISRTFTITVTNVLEVTLGALTIDDDEAVPGEPWSATISGKSTGSTITATSSDGTVLTVVGTTVSGTFAAEGTPGYSLSEAHPDATNSPRVSTGTITVAPMFSLGTPVLAWVSPEDDDTPEFTIELALPEEGDSVQIQIASDAGFTTIVFDEAVTVTADHIADGEIPFTATPLANGTFYARAKQFRGPDESEWSNVETVTIDAVTHVQPSVRFPGTRWVQKSADAVPADGTNMVAFMSLTCQSVDEEQFILTVDGQYVPAFRILANNSFTLFWPTTNANVIDITVAAALSVGKKVQVVVTTHQTGSAMFWSYVVKVDGSVVGSGTWAGIGSSDGTTKVNLSAGYASIGGTSGDPGGAMKADLHGLAIWANLATEIEATDAFDLIFDENDEVRSSADLVAAFGTPDVPFIDLDAAAITAGVDGYTPTGSGSFTDS